MACNFFQKATELNSSPKILIDQIRYQLLICSWFTCAISSLEDSLEKLNVSLNEISEIVYSYIPV